MEWRRFVWDVEDVLDIDFSDFKKFNWSKWSFWLAVPIAIATGYYFMNLNKPEINFEILSSTEVLTMNEDLSSLKIMYKDINLKEAGKNISIFKIKISNEGYQSVVPGYYDENYPLGFIIKEGELISFPEIEESSDSAYYKNAIDSTTSNTVLFNKLILDPKSYLTISLKLLNTVNKNP